MSANYSRRQLMQLTVFGICSLGESVVVQVQERSLLRRQYCYFKSPISKSEFKTLKTAMMKRQRRKGFHGGDLNRRTVIADYLGQQSHPKWRQCLRQSSYFLSA